MSIKYPVPHLPMLGKGSVLFDRFDANGNPQGFIHLGNCSKFELDMKDEAAQLFQSLNKVPSLVATTLKKRTPSLSITGTDFSSDHMAITMMSSGKTTLSIAVTEVTGEALASATATKRGKFFELASRSVDPATVVCHQGSTALVAGTDFVVSDPVEGLIYFPAAGAVDDTKAVTADYSTLVKTFDQVAGGTQPVLQGRIRFVPDPSDGQKIGVEVWRVNLAPNGQIGLIADDYGNWTLDASVLDDTANHPNAPYYLATFE
jgi:hypothetical protein